MTRSGLGGGLAGFEIFTTSDNRLNVVTGIKHKLIACCLTYEFCLKQQLGDRSREVGVGYAVDFADGAGDTEGVKPTTGVETGGQQVRLVLPNYLQNLAHSSKTSRHQ